MKWVTRSHVHVDRVACPWLIKRFIDSQPEFIFVPRKEIERVVREEGAVAFDAPGVELGHHDNLCSFETIIHKYELKDPALLRLAKIVHAADIDSELDTDPIARGLDAIAVGFSLRFPDDEENIAGQFEVYDALYAWCQLQVAKDKARAGL
jgi:hypothetical protein